MPILTAACSAAQFERIERLAIDAVVTRSGGTVAWRCSRRFDQAFASIELRDPADVEALRARTGATLYEGTVIALAVTPTQPEALPALVDALAGPGAPAGVRWAEVRAGALCVAWDVATTDACIVMGIVDAELRRFAAARSVALLSPLPLAAMTGIVAKGLNAPEIAPDRVLEALIEERHAAGD